MVVASGELWVQYAVLLDRRQIWRIVAAQFEVDHASKPPALPCPIAMVNLNESGSCFKIPTCFQRARGSIDSRGNRADFGHGHLNEA